MADEISSAVGTRLAETELPETFGYTLKRKLLGPPLVNEQMADQRLSRPLALGVLSCDGISSAAYGTEEMLIEMIQVVGLAAFTLILPMTLVVLAGIALVVLSYREVVSVYTRAGGSYVVARENFGPRVAQVAAVALLIDYTVTVAVQTAAGSAAIVSAFPQLAKTPLIGSHILVSISVVAVLIMCYGNLRGIREAGRAFALPTYLFSGSVALMIVVGLIREATGHLHHVSAYPAPTFVIGHSTEGIISVGIIYMLLKAFANGGSSLTGIEAVSNAVGALRPPEGRNARQILITQGSIVAFLIAGISWLAHITHAIPYQEGFPTVLAQEANVIFGHEGHFMYFVVQVATALILFTGGNTSFSGFPFLASFVASDSFLPRWLTKRGHRLALSNGIIVLTVVSLILLVTTGAEVNGLIPFYAIGVFTGFAMAGFGMAKYHKRVKERGWRRRRIINATAAVYTAIVVIIFAVVKFTEGAWLIVIVFPVLVYLLIRLNREYRMEAEVLASIGDRRAAGVPQRPTNYSRRVVLIFVDDVDLATFAAIRYARGLRPTTMRAVHFVIDSAQARKIGENWLRYGQDIPLEMIDTPDRRLTRASLELVSREAQTAGTQVTVVLPRRGYAPLLGRLLHDRTADKIASIVSQVPDSAATIIPFNVQSRVRLLHGRPMGPAGAPERAAKVQSGSVRAQGGGTQGGGTKSGETHGDGTQGRETRGNGTPGNRTQGNGTPGNGVPGNGTPGNGTQGNGTQGNGTQGNGTQGNATTGNGTQGSGTPGSGGQGSGTPGSGQPTAASPGRPDRAGKTSVEGRVTAVSIRPVGGGSVFAATVDDGTASLTALFYGRASIPGLEPGTRLRLDGKVSMREGGAVMINPAYELLPRDG